MGKEKPSIERPLWVKAAVWGLPNRAAVWACLGLTIALAIASVVYGFWDARFLAGGLLIVAALWYFLAIRWIDQHGSWS